MLLSQVATHAAVQSHPAVASHAAGRPPAVIPSTIADTSYATVGSVTLRSLDTPLVGLLMICCQIAAPCQTTCAAVVGSCHTRFAKQSPLLTSEQHEQYEQHEQLIIHSFLLVKGS